METHRSAKSATQITAFHRPLRHLAGMSHVVTHAEFREIVADPRATAAVEPTEQVRDSQSQPAFDPSRMRASPLTDPEGGRLGLTRCPTRRMLLLSARRERR
jgi:hypothetical protein